MGNNRRLAYPGDDARRTHHHNVVALELVIQSIKLNQQLPNVAKGFTADVVVDEFGRNTFYHHGEAHTAAQSAKHHAKVVGSVACFEGHYAVEFAVGGKARGSEARASHTEGEGYEESFKHAHRLSRVSSSVSLPSWRVAELAVTVFTTAALSGRV